MCESVVNQGGMPAREPHPLRVLGLIPARGGSKGIPRKNLAPAGGRPLIAWSIEAALASGRLDRLLVSTDAPDIARAAQGFGAEAPFLRPGDLATEDSPSILTVLHALAWLEEGEAYLPDYVMLLQPTSPLRTGQDIRGAVDIALGRGAESVVSVSPLKRHPEWAMTLGEDGRLRLRNGKAFGEQASQASRRQDLPPCYAENGAIYLVKTRLLRTHRTFYGREVLAYLMPEERSLDVDSPLDLEIVDALLRRKGQGGEEGAP